MHSYTHTHPLHTIRSRSDRKSSVGRKIKKMLETKYFEMIEKRVQHREKSKREKKLFKSLVVHPKRMCFFVHFHHTRRVFLWLNHGALYSLHTQHTSYSDIIYIMHCTMLIVISVYFSSSFCLQVVT